MKIPYQIPRGEPNGSTNGREGKRVADKIAILAQKYAGFFTGKFYRFDQQSLYRVVTDEDEGGIHVGKAWKEPNVLSDDCQFCQRLTDDEVVRRVLGYQHALDIEVIRAKGMQYTDWLVTGNDIVEFEDMKDIITSVEDGVVVIKQLTRSRPKFDSAANRRKFVELFQDKGQDASVRPVWSMGFMQIELTSVDGWERKVIPLVDLPPRLKRKLCIEWNHVYRDFLEDNPGITYDFETKKFYKEMPELGPSECCGGITFYDHKYESVVVHRDSCEQRPVPEETGMPDIEDWTLH